MSRDPRATARACFALAARAGTEGEKAAALNRGMAIVDRYKLDPNQFHIPGRIAGKRADRIIVDDPHERSPYAEHRPMNAELANAILEAMIKQMAAGGYSTPFADAAFGRRETATQKAEREREERMSAFVASQGLWVERP